MKTPTANASLADVLDLHTAVGSLGHVEDDRIRCVACGHRCLIGDGKRGICKVRFNDAGRLKVPFGYVAGLQCDPVEKKPFFHVYPSSDALTFGMMGCDLHCSYCQNWVTSQALRDSSAVAPIRPVTANQLVELAQRERARLVVSSYNEPLITAEWAVAVFEQAKAAGLACAFVSNGNATPEVLDFLKPWIVAYKVDLKSFDDRHYRTLGGMLSNITDTIRMIHERGIWLEVVTLVIPGFNDSERELRDMARFLASVSRDIPWHVTAFHKDYRMTDPDGTSPQKLMRAAEIGAEEGLRFLYAGNLPGQVGAWENTRCPDCRATVIERVGYLIRDYQLTADGCCSKCGTRLPGIWPSDEVRTGNDMNAYRQRLPRPLPLSPLSPRGAVGEGAVPHTPGDKPMSDDLSPLTDDQKNHLVRSVAAMVRAIAAGRGAEFDDSNLGGQGDRLVAGAFVSLKRGKHLRGCCGMLGESVSLRVALAEAARRTVFEDVRFPPVSPSEVEHLNLEVWLLQPPAPVNEKGENRLAAITIGKHGVKVIRGNQAGLFLPSVAVDNRWDGKRLLDQVCLKAGLHASAWLDEATALYTFEGEVLRGRLGDGNGTTKCRSVCSADELRQLASYCCNNIGSLLVGATPTYYAPGLPDGDVAGVLLTLERPTSNGPDVTHLSQISLRPGVPLQSTLFTLCQRAAQTITEQQWSAESLGAVQVGVSVLHDPVLHGTVLDVDFAGIDTKERALLVLERNKGGLVYDPAREPNDLLRDGIREARVSQAAHAPVFSLEAVSHGPFTLSTAPRPVRGSEVRRPSAAGRFYAADAVQLAHMVDSLLAGPYREQVVPAAMVPHAGLIYSGHIAADVLKRIRIPRSVIVIGPKHTPYGVDWAVAPHRTWAFPGGSVESDRELAEQLCAAIPGLEMDAAAHQQEHAVEVELPLLARLAPGLTVVGIAIGAGDLESCLGFAEGLAKVMRAREDRPLLLISSDMNHFATDAENRRLDAIALDAIQRLDPAEVYETVTTNQITMCGLLPAVIVLETLRLMGTLHRAERVGYATSAEVTGDPSRVVGYAGMLFS